VEPVRQVSLRFDRQFRSSAAEVRSLIAGREQILFDLLCTAGQLVYRLPHDDINLKHIRGAKDPRRRLRGLFSRAYNAATRTRAQTWARASDRLYRVLRDELESRGDGELRPLRVLLAYAPGALAPDCVVPRDRLLYAAWRTVVKLFDQIFPSAVAETGPIKCVDNRRLAQLRREAAAHLPRGRRASGKRAGPEGRRLAVDPHLMAAVSRALGREVAPGYQARHLIYTKPGDHFWPHPDDPRYDVQVLLCIDHRPPRGRMPRSAFLTYQYDGRVQRHQIPPGSALAIMPGRVHAREPLRPGEQLILLSIGLHCHSTRAREAPAG
jgi:hypothetical protein